MGKKKKGDDTDESAKAGKGKTIGMAVGFALLGAVVGPKLLGSGGAAASETGPTTTTTEAGPVVVLDKVTLNLSDGHLLQVGLALELDPEHAAGGGGHGGEVDKDDPTKGYAKAIDAAIEVFGDQTMADLSAAGGRDHSKEELTEELHELYHDEIKSVYFHTFVMQ